jgi:hypothetical protein
MGRSSFCIPALLVIAPGAFGLAATGGIDYGWDSFEDIF